MRIIGLDLGSKTCGVAQSDLAEKIAVGVKTLHFDSEDYEMAIDLVIEEFQALKGNKIVIGLPRHMNGDIGERGRISQKFAEILTEELGVEVVLWDERLTTVSAQRMLIEADVSRKKRKEVIDKVAATFILQSYLDSQRK